MKVMTFLWLLIAAVTGVAVLLLKHDVEALETELKTYNAQITADQETIHVLKAEWSYLNDPVRLRALAERHLGLVPMGPEKITSFADLPMRDGASPDNGGEPMAQAPASELPGAATAAPPEYSLADGTVVPGHPSSPPQPDAPKGLMDRIGYWLDTWEARR